MTLTDIIGYLPHGLIGYHPAGAICKIDMAFAAKYDVELCNYRPVLRPMTDLLTEITEKGYNDGKPFVPIAWIKDHCFDLWRSGLSGTKKEYKLAICNAHEAYDLLHRWHFDYRGLIEAGDAVSIYDLKRNPYENE